VCKSGFLRNSLHKTAARWCRTPILWCSPCLWVQMAAVAAEIMARDLKTRERPITDVVGQARVDSTPVEPLSCGYVHFIPGQPRWQEPSESVPRSFRVCLELFELKVLCLLAH